MSDSVKKLEEQLLALKKGLFLMSPRDRVRALSTHETEDLIIELQDVADAALESLESVKK
ncbi:hypothetical protein QWZ13_15935 [Reinekea marina]|uniref:Uncharacterized protein n=1 Tax=Reinekea marina TaxID=1310421 RepID=A0ABV7WPV2_9GAMM|nr:hypothetical protein [Reinekea marina]MBU2863690.1 hypothetical protein [Reinekea forsetii]MDN3650398.1 hypothetical protein [Reinekea marina]